jgi:hypothetical protein
MAKIKISEITGVSSRPTICADKMCIWFNTSSSTPIISYCGFSGVGSWTTTNPLSVGRNNLAGTGTQNESLAIGGYFLQEVSNTEEYNGSTWSSGGVLITARQVSAAAGIINAGLIVGGLNTSVPLSSTEEYDGTTWTSGGILITARRGHGGAGTQNDGLIAGGTTTCSCTEEYNGSTWSTGGVLINGRALSSAGTQNSGIAVGGRLGLTVVGCTEEYNGTYWSTSIALITSRSNLVTTGIQNQALTAGGRTTAGVESDSTEEYNGTSWSSGCTMITARQSLGGAGGQGSGVVFAGGASCTNVTEEYNKPIEIIDSIQ